MSPSVLFRAVVYLALVGAVVIGACRMAASQWAFGWLTDLGNVLALEQARGERLGRQLPSAQRRCEEKAQALEGLLAGRLTFEETIQKFRRVEEDTVLPWDASAEVATARVVLHWVTSMQQDDPRAAEALPKVRAEFEARFGR